MKRRLSILCALCFLCMEANSQTSGSNKAGEDAEPSTRIESRLLASGELIEVKFQNVGALKSKGLLASTTFLGVQVVTIVNLFTNVKSSGLKLGLPVGSSYGKYQGDAIYLDSDEVELMVKALEKINSEVVKTSSKENSNMMFISRSGFMVGCRSNDGKWTPFLRLSKSIPDSEVSWFKITELETLSGLLKQALPLLTQ